MQFLYYKNKIINILSRSLPKSVLLWYVLLFSAILISIIFSTMMYYNIYKIYTNTSEIENVQDEYEPIIDLDDIDNIVNSLGL